MPPQEAFLQIRDALYLDGGGSAQIYVKAKGFQDFLQGFDTVPVGLGFFPCLFSALRQNPMAIYSVLL